MNGDCTVPRHLAMCLRCMTMKNVRIGSPECDRCITEQGHDPSHFGRTD